MKISFISNYYNHHQHALCQALSRETGGRFSFIATSEMRDERKKLGYGQWEVPDYVLRAHADADSARRCGELIRDADLVIAGAAPEKKYLPRILKRKLVFRYTERPLKKMQISLRQKLHFHRTRLLCGPASGTYLLCAGAYTAADYLNRGCYRGRTYKWGYFPAVRRYDDLPGLMEGKEKNSILWAGRFLDWKHPEQAVLTAKRLKQEKIPFVLRIIGTGEMEAQLKEMVNSQDLQDCVEFLGAMAPGEVRSRMERSEIFLFTSDRQEGWGAVLNEAMNSGCAVVASHAAGSVPFLLKNGENGCIYPSGDTEALFRKTKYLLEHPEARKRRGMAACETITTLWNGEVAAKRLTELAERVLSGEKNPELYKEGPCSKAEALSDDWYQE